MSEPVDLGSPISGSKGSLSKQQTSQTCVACGSTQPVVILWDSNFDHPDLRGKECFHYRLVKCIECGFVFVTPQPGSEVMSLLYPPSYYQHRQYRRTWTTRIKHRIARWRFSGYNGLTASNDDILARALAMAVEWLTGRHVPFSMGIPLNLPKDAAILDVGCGGGEFLLALRDYGYCNLWGVDISDYAAEPLARAGIRFHAGDLSSAHLPLHSFDLIRMEHVLEHLSDPLETLRLCHSLLRPGGMIVLNVPNIDSLSFRLFGKSFAHLDLPRHLYHYSPTSLRGLAHRAGLCVRNVRTLAVWAVFARSANLHFQAKGRRFWAKLFAHPMAWILSPLYGALVTVLGHGDCVSAVLTVEG